MLISERKDEQETLLRILAYGNGKTKKTWWAGAAAETGYNVLLLDGDNGSHILKQLTPQAQSRVQAINLNDKRGNPLFAQTLAKLLKRGKLVWDEKERKIATLQPNEDCIQIDLDILNDNCVVVVDSWTELCVSLLIQYAKENNIDLSIAEEDENKWGYFRWAGALASWMITQLRGLNCHVIVIGHTDVYEKRSKDGKTIEWQKRQVKSTSGPHAMQMPSRFDILYFKQKGTAYKIETRGNEDADGGTRLVPPGDYNWDDLQFKDLILALGADLPDANNPHIDYSVTAKAPAQKTGLVKPIEKPAAKISLGGGLLAK